MSAAVTQRRLVSSSQSMPGLVHAFVGRQAELRALTSAVEAGESGAGSVWLLVGEAGIGKTRLAEEFARLAEGRGWLVAWGRAWESGGAPPFWTWGQVLRTIRRRRGGVPRDHAIGSVLAQILPELGADTAASAAAGLDPAFDQAQFRLLDAAVTALLDASEAGPIAVVLEDLHAADRSSLLLLDLLCAEVRTTRLLVLGTLRDASASPIEAQLARIGRNARVVTLNRLEPEAVASYLIDVLPRDAAERVTPSIQAACEGNPLFMVELTRWLLSEGRLRAAAPAAALVVPNTIKAVIGERLSMVAPETRSLLYAAAVLGREFSLAVLSQAAKCSCAELEPKLEASGGIVERLGAERCRFSHVLLREALYEAIPTEERAALHVQAADACLAAGSSGQPSWSEPAHHLLRAGPAFRERAIEAARCAGEQALGQLAFDEAVTWLARALSELDKEAEPRARRFELLLALGRARMFAGDVDAGRALCEEAAALARDAGAPRLFARAALEYGGVFLLARVSGTLVALLQEALDGLGDGEPRLAARVMARLAAALQPAKNPREPIAIAGRAVALARQTGDAQVLLDVLRSAGAALADLAPPAEREPLNREHLALAERLGDAGETLRAGLRLLLDAFELADSRQVTATLAVIERSAERLAVPHALWRAALASAMAHAFAGRFELAAEDAARAARCAERARDPNAGAVLALQRLLIRGLIGDDDAVPEAVAAVRRALTPDRIEHEVFNLVEQAALARTGRLRSPIRCDPGLVEFVFQLGDMSAFSCLCDAALASSDLALSLRLYERLVREAAERRFVNWGMVGLFVGVPVALLVARLASKLGKNAEAEAAFVRALADTDAAGARPYRVWVRFEHARHLAPDLGARERQRALLESALGEATELEMSGLARTIDSELRGLTPAEPGTASSEPCSRPVRATRNAISVRRLGDVWEVAGAGTVVHLPATRGLQMLARLVAEPHKVFHVLDLAGERAAEAGVQLGASDAGPLIDDAARNAYRRRLGEIDEELVEAEQWNDVARAERLRGELDALQAELARGVGLGGRLRKAGSASERARVNVQRRLKDVIRRLSALAPALGQELERGLKTGIRCCYDPSEPV
jgi:tetratricopeptide (TPR) repeat protein